MFALDKYGEKLHVGDRVRDAQWVGTIESLTGPVDPMMGLEGPVVVAFDDGSTGNMLPEDLIRVRPEPVIWGGLYSRGL